MQPKSKLPQLFTFLLRRKLAFAFQKIMLAEDDSNQYSAVRHYDLECQGAQTIRKILQCKYSVIMMTAFHKIKNAKAKKAKKPALRLGWLSKNENSNYFESKIMGKQVKLSPISSIKKQKQFSSINKQRTLTPKTSKNRQNFTRLLTQLEEVDNYLSGFPNNRKRRMQETRKNSKKQLILEKIKKIEMELGKMMKEEEESYYSQDILNQCQL